MVEESERKPVFGQIEDYCVVEVEVWAGGL